MISKYKILISALLAIILIIVLVLILISSNKPKLNVPDSTGENITVNDFISENPLDSDYATAMVESDKYVAQYDKINNAFQIAFTVFSIESLKVARTEAEIKLMQQLGVDKEQFCKLKVVEIVPDNGVLNLPVYNFPPSFCPGGNVIP